MSQHGYRGTPIAIKRGIRTCQTEIKEGQARNAFEDQERSEKVTRPGFS